MKKVRFGEWFSEGFGLLKNEWRTWVLISLIYIIPVGLIYGISQVISFQISPQMPSNARTFSEIIAMMTQSLAQSLVLSLLTAFGINIVQAFLLGGVYRTAFKQIKGEPISVGDMFSGMDLFVKILVAAVLLTIIQFIGALLCYIPLLIAQGMLFFTVPLIVRKNMEPVEALKASFEATKREWLVFTAFAFVLNIAAMIGVIACGIGILFTLPLLFLCTAVAYRDWFEPESRQVSIEAPKMKYCHACGAPMEQAANFCGNCGAGQP